MAVDSIYNMSTKMRISGMSSGWDTDQLVQSMLASEKNRVTKAFQAVAKMEFKRDAYRGVNSLVTSFNNSFLSVAGSKSIKSTETFRAYKVKMAENTGVKVTANNSAAVGSYSVSVEQVATGARIESGNTVDASFNMNTTLADVGIDFAQGDETSNITLNLKNGDKEVEIVLNSADTLGNMVKKINSSGLGITATISEITGKFTLTSKETGAASTLNLVEESRDANDDSVDILGALGFNLSAPIAGQDAIYEINGNRRTSDTNRIDIDGLNIELIEPTDGTVKFVVEKDSDKAVDAIKEFVQSINTLYQTLHSLTNEKMYRSFQPLTPDERGALSESEATKWDAKAKSGIIRKDVMIESLMTDIRMAFTQKVPGSDLTFADIGITSDKFSDRVEGAGPSWVIDEAKLRKALDEDPGSVEKMFVQDTFTGSNRYEQSGIAARLTIAVDNYTTKIRETKYTVSDFEKKIADLNTIMTRANVRFASKQESLYAKLAAMETSLSKMQSQSNWLASQIGG